MGTIWLMEPCANWDVDSFNVSDMDYWRRPRAVRESSSTTLRLERPISRYEEPVIEGISIEFPAGNDVHAASLVVMGCRGAATLPRGL